MPTRPKIEDVDDMTFTGLLQVGQESLGAVDHAPEVDVHQPLEVVVVHVFYGSAQCHTGVVEDHVGVAEMVDHIVGEIIERLAVGHVENLGHQTIFAEIQAVGGFFQAGFINVG